MAIDAHTDHVYGIVPVRQVGKEYEYLIIKSRRGRWGFPKGHPHPGENPIEAARREFIEETGIKEVRIDPQCSFEDSYALPDELRVITKRVTWYLGLVPQGILASPVDFEEITESRWVSYDTAVETLSHEGTKKALLAITTYLNDHQ